MPPVDPPTGPPEDLPEDVGGFSPDLEVVLHELILAEAETRILHLLADNGFPTDLTRAPTAAEVTSRTSFAALEADVATTTTQLVTALTAARAALLGNVAGILAGTFTIAEVLRRLDFTVAGVLTVPGILDVLTDLQATVRGLLAALVRRAGRRLVADAARARIVPTSAVTLEDLLSRPTVEEVLDVQASRLATETTTSTVRAVRDTAHRSAASAAAAGGAGGAGGGDPVSRFIDDVVATTARSGFSRGLTDSAHQAALAANGAGRVAAAAAYDRGRPAGQDPRQDGLPSVEDLNPTRGAPTADFAPEDGARYYASELLDRNTCAPCSEVDGREYDTLTEALADYPLGLYRDCEGGTRCRGTIVAVSARETPPSLRTPFGR